MIFFGLFNKLTKEFEQLSHANRLYIGACQRTFAAREKEGRWKWLWVSLTAGGGKLGHSDIFIGR